MALDDLVVYNYPGNCSKGRLAMEDASVRREMGMPAHVFHVALIKWPKLSAMIVLTADDPWLQNISSRDSFPEIIYPLILVSNSTENKLQWLVGMCSVV